MKFHNKKWKSYLMKGLAFVLLINAICSTIPPLVAKAAPSAATITEDTTKDFYSYMVSSGYPQDKTGKSKDRIVLLSEFLHAQNSEIKSISSDERDDYETSGVVWNPSQTDVNAGRDLYFLQWTNGDGYTNPGSGYEILSRIVYLTKDGKIRYSNQVNIDDYPRELLDLGHKEQWDNKRVNQCYFAVPEECAQIVGILMLNQSGGWENDNTWWMDNLTIYRIESDNISDITKSEQNGLNHNQISFKAGRIAAFVSGFDINNRYLATDDTREEWLYLLQAADEETASLSSGSNYYAQIVTGNSDLSGRDLLLELTYTDVMGIERTHKQTVNDSAVESFYPELTYPKKIQDKGPLPVRDLRNIIGVSVNVVNDYSFDYYTKYANHIAMEITKQEGAVTEENITKHLKSYGNFSNYSWDAANTSVTNLYAFLLFGNFVDYNAMKEDILGPNTATDIRLDITIPIKEIKEIRLSLQSGSESAVVQDVRIYASSADNFARTRMNGGLGTERVFYDVSDARCLASVDPSRLIELTGNGVVTCCLDPTVGNTRQYQLLQHTGREMSLMAEDDNLGVQISLADVYNAGYEIFMTRKNDRYEYPKVNNYIVVGGAMYDQFYKIGDLRAYILEKLPSDSKLIDPVTALELFNLMESYYKESLTLNIRYKDEFGSVREVEIPFVTSYLMQLYSDNNGKLGTDHTNFLTGILQQGEDAGLRVPLSQYSELVDATLTFGSSTAGIANFKNNKYYYYNDPDVEYPKYDHKFELVGYGSYEEMWEYYEHVFHGDSDYPYFRSRHEVKELLGAYETMEGGKIIPNEETISIRSIRFYEHVTKEDFCTVYDKTKRIATLSTTKESDYYYVSKNGTGTTFAIGHQLKLSSSEGTLTKGYTDYSQTDIKNTYLVKLTTQSLLSVGGVTADDLYVTLSYTTTDGAQKQITAQRLSDLGKNYFGGNNMSGITDVTTAYEYQTKEALRAGYGYFLIDLENVSRFDYVHFSLKDGAKYGIQINNVSIYDLESLSQRYSSSSNCTNTPLFVRDFTGERVAYNNKPAALQPNREGVTYHFTKINSDGTIEEPDTDSTYEDEYLLIPPTSMTYEETLKNLGLSVTKYTYTVDVNVANVLDAGSSNYFYFQLVFENGTSGVVLANQQLASDSFRQGYTESFTINTTQNYGNVTAVRVICDTTSSTSQAFDKLNIDSIAVSLPSKGGAKSWIIDKVGWIDINFQDEGVATTISDDGRSGGFPNSQVVKEFARTRTASTAMLLFSISTAANSATSVMDAALGSYEASITYEDTAGYTQNYNFDLKSAIYDYMENESYHFLFRPNMTNYFAVSINDISSVKSLNLYRSNSAYDWVVKDVSLSQFSEMGDVYKSTSGEFKRYLENETLIATSTNSNLTIKPNATGTFIFESHSISIDTSTNDPATWTTTITRVPTTTQESLNIYLYAGSTEDRTYAFNPESIPNIKGRFEYTFKEGGSIIGSEAFTFTDSGTINGTTVLKATGIKVTGMNQLKTLHLETASAASPIISGAKVERIRGNTIIETLYFDYANTAMNAGQNYSTTAKADTISSTTKQILALQLSSGQEQIFNTTSDVAVALLYTSENNSSDIQKTVYSSPYVFFTDVGISSLGNASILEIPFEISGADHIAGISIISNGPNVKFENAIAYNYIENINTERILIDTCQIAQKFNSSTVEKTLMKEDNANVTPVTLTFTTSADSNFQGSGTSGRLPLTIHYKTLDNQDTTLVISNFADLLPANTLPTSGSNVSFRVHLSNFAQLTSIDLSAPNDDWHLNKISAEIQNINKATTTYQQREAFVEKWITSQAPVTVTFGTGNDSETAMNQIINFSVTGQTGSSGNVATATSGDTLHIQATPSEQITFTPLVTISGSPDNMVIWDTTQYGNYMRENGNNGLTFHVPSNSVGQVYSFATYCSYDQSKTITITIEIVKSVPPTTGGGTTGDIGGLPGGTTGPSTGGTTNGNTTQQEASVNVNISINNGGSSQDGPALPSFSAEEGAAQSYSIFVKPGEYMGTWSFGGNVNLTGYNAAFSPAALTIGQTPGTYTTTMICTDSNGSEQFRVSLNIIVVNLQISMTASGTGMTPSVITFDASSAPYTFTIPYSETAAEYQLVLTDNHDEAKAIFSGTGNTLTFQNHQNDKFYAKGTIIKTTNAVCSPIDGTGQSFSIPITIKVAD